jgi:hypothetical protein
MPLPQLLYAQVVKSCRRRRIVGVKQRVVFGTLERVEQVLLACGRQINTAFVERLNLDIRQRVAAVGRRVNTLCQGENGLRQQVAVYHASIISAYLMRVCASPCGFLNPPTAEAPPRCGDPVRQRWRPD